MKSNSILLGALATDHSQFAGGQSEAGSSEQDLAVSDGADDAMLSGADFWAKYEPKTYGGTCQGSVALSPAQNTPFSAMPEKRLLSSAAKLLAEIGIETEAQVDLTHLRMCIGGSSPWFRMFIGGPSPCFATYPQILLSLLR